MILSGIKDDAGNQMKEFRYCWFVIAENIPDTTSPEITTTNPADGATGVSRHTTITVTFSEQVKNVNASTFTVKADGNPVSGNVALKGLTATFTASDPYPYSAEVTAQVTKGVKDIAGNALKPFSFSFTVEDDPSIDTTPPEVVATNPADGAVDVRADSRIYVTFSEPVFRVGGSFVHVYANGELFDGSWFHHNGDSTAYFLPQTNSFPYSAAIEVVFTSGVLDSAGNALIEYSFSFTIRKNIWTLPDDNYQHYKMKRVIGDQENNIYVGGIKDWNNRYDFFIAKFLSDGTLSWLKDIPASANTDAIGFIDIEVAGNAVIINRDENIGKDWYNYLTGYDAESGDKVWENVFSGSGRAIDIYGSNIFGITTHSLYIADISYGSVINSVSVAAATGDIDVNQDHIYVSAGFFSIGHQDNDYRMLAYNHDLSLAWSADWGTDYEENPPRVRVTNDAVYLAGSTGDNDLSPVLLKYDFNGNLVFDSVYVNLAASGDYPVHGMDTDGENLYMVYGPNKFSPDGEVLYANYPGGLAGAEAVFYFDNKLYEVNFTNQLKIYDAGSGAQIFP